MNVRSERFGFGGLRGLWLLGLVGWFCAGPAAEAVVPDSAGGMPRISGVYKVMAGSDPLLPAGPGHEWFFDFGSGMTQGRQSGNVSVSLRRNPAVQVRIMVWQAVPKQRRLLLGNAAAKGSNRAVVRADWRVTQQSDAIVLERDGHRLVLKRPEPGDY